MIIGELLPTRRVYNELAVNEQVLPEGIVPFNPSTDFTNSRKLFDIFTRSRTENRQMYFMSQSIGSVEVQANIFVVVLGTLTIDDQVVEAGHYAIIEDSNTHKIKNEGSDHLILVTGKGRAISDLTKELTDWNDTVKVMATPLPTQESADSLRRQVLIRPFLTAEQCQTIIASCTEKDMRPASIVAPEGMQAGNKVDYERRKAFHLDSKNPQAINDLIQSAATHEIDKFFNTVIESWEEPTVVFYPVGGHFLPHADSTHNDSETGETVKYNNRDYSVSIYLNTEYQGGDLVFPQLGLTVPKQAGMLVVFPSDDRFIHTVTPVTEGKRYQIVTWLHAFGSERTHNPAKHGKLPKRIMRKW